MAIEGLDYAFPSWSASSCCESLNILKMKHWRGALFALEPSVYDNLSDHHRNYQIKDYSVSWLLQDLGF